jgi:hypothetical protein
MSERNAKDVVEELFRRQQTGDESALDDLVAADMVNHAAGPQGREGLKRILRVIDHDLGRVTVEPGRARRELQRRRLFAAWPSDAWREGVGVDDALDCSAAMYNADVFLLLTQERGWTPDRVER